MDSFYDQPRSAPIPTNINQIFSTRVPEVSIIIPPEINSSIQNKPLPAENKLPYNVWKTQNQNVLERIPRTKCNKENLVLNSKSEYDSQNVSKVSSRKHVRFNSPQTQKHVLESSNNVYINDSDGDTKFNEQEYIHCNNQKSKTACNKPFEQIYMANIPNRHLDLSIMESSNCINKNSMVKNDEQKNCDKSTNMLLFNKIDKKHIEYRNDEENCDTSRNFCKSNFLNLRKTPYSPSQEYNYQLQPTNYKRQDGHVDPTVKDLLKVVQQQNEQILLLQKQVSLLLQNQSNQKQVEMPPFEGKPPLQDSINNTEKENLQYHNPKGTLSKFAIDVMTSFEVSIRSPKLPQNKLISECGTTPKIQEIADTETNNHDQKIDSDNKNGETKQGFNEDNEIKQNTDLSLILDKPIEVVERCLSPVNSVHVDMKDYSSDSDDGSSEVSTDIGWTVYNNIMGQVNNLLKKTNTDLKDIGCTSDSNNITDKTLKKVKDATMRHLKSIGVNLPIIEEPGTSQRSNETVNGSEYTPTEVSFAVKQLLMKYLPDEQLAKITHAPPLHPTKENVKYNTENLIKRRPEFSFATVQYMKKYNLLNSDMVYQDPPQQPNKHNEVPKILDVTALKQQPKLL